ncbi:hypothetical protein RE6C_01640 [Rhodopirellula europaea 6C]|uniref:Uncharacterized protein n=1 Tax=Rhodopirellula europaea 6C TaxID=1263867 RepID=M2B5U6_9BACT|nr:hypothetical protein RE6C_01640 [Rhodopirellula europaea 6C]
MQFLHALLDPEHDRINDVAECANVPQRGIEPLVQCFGGSMPSGANIRM